MLGSVDPAGAWAWRGAGGGECDRFADCSLANGQGRIFSEAHRKQKREIARVVYDAVMKMFLRSARAPASAPASRGRAKGLALLACASASGAAAAAAVLTRSRACAPLTCHHGVRAPAFPSLRRDNCIHGDVHAGNVLFCARTGQITVIDAGKGQGCVLRSAAYRELASAHA